MELTLPNLQTINNNVNMLFNSQLFMADTVYQDYTMAISSTGDAEVYPRLDMLPGIRQWIGSREKFSLSQETFSIKNVSFEETISLLRDQFEDDKFGLFAPAASQLGEDARTLPDKLVAGLMKNGTSTLWVDGQDFFSTSHVSFPNTGSAAVNSNYQAGGGPSWYMIDNSKVLRPFIYQTRRPFKITALFSDTDPNVFFDREFIWGTDGRCAAGYGLYQLIFRSDAQLNLANIIAAQTAMAAWQRPDGSPQGVFPTQLVCPTALYPAAMAYATNDFDPNQLSNLTPNTVKGTFKAIRNPYLS